MLGKKLIQAAAGAAGGGGLGIEDVFSTWLYTGNSSTQTITNGIDLAGEGGLVWLKNRSLSASHALIDTELGGSQHLRSNSTDGSGSSYSISFNVDGFSIGSSAQDVNESPRNYASWTFRKAKKFFDVVTWTGNGTDGRQIAHNLGSAPGCVIIKRTDSAIGWAVYHRSSTTTYGELNSTNAFATSQLGGYNMQEVFGNSSAVILPDASNITVARFSPTNASGGTYVAYLFAHDAGGFGDSGNESVVSCGQVEGVAGTEVNLGWEPQWVLIKCIDEVREWFLVDNMRSLVGDAVTNNAYLSPNLSNAEDNNRNIYITPTGFKLSTSTAFNSSTHIYIAIRRGPMKTPTDATEVFAVDYGSSSATIPTYDSGFPVDLGFTSNSFSFASRLTGVKALDTYTTAAEASNGNFLFDSNVGWAVGFGATQLSYMFRRAPGFFDVVAYTGTGSARTVAHNLGVAPELIISKSRSNINFWYVYTSALGAGSWLRVNSDGASVSDIYAWNNTAPTSSVFSLGPSVGADNNNSGWTFVTYLFATLSGVSKVGSYTGTGTTLDIDCGFTAGARFVLIKRTDSTGDWYVWDTARGIVSGNDPYYLLNVGTETTGTDYIDPLASGFQITSTAPAAINASGGSFIFLAVA